MADYLKHLIYVIQRVFLYVLPGVFDNLSVYIKVFVFPLFLFILAYIISLLVRRVRGV